MFNLLGKHFIHFFLTAFCFITTQALAQNQRVFIKTADKFFELENYRAAIPFYEQILNEDNENALALFRAGVSYLAYDKDRASDYLYKAQRLNPKVAPDIEYWLGRADHVNYRFDDAIDHYLLYAKTLPKKASTRQEVNLLITQSRNAQKMVQNPKDLFVRNLGPTINTPYSDHSPVISRDNNYLLYTTRSHISAHAKASADGKYFEEIVKAVRQDANNWFEPRSLSLHLNSKGHDASIQLLENDTKLLLYRQTQNGDFFISSKKGIEWSIPAKITGNINTKDFESDAFITADGSTMYFATNHFSVKGDKDLFVAHKTIKGEWDKPQKIDKNINTGFDEDSPFLMPDGKTMYFTSRGHNTMGGYDVFVTHLDSTTQTWTAPENMGYPVNSPDDDTYFRLDADGTTAYLSSYRMGGYGEKDIWTIDLSKNVILKGQVTSQKDKANFNDLEITFSSHPINNKALKYSTTAINTGAFEVQLQSGRKYQVTFLQNGKIIDSQEYEVPATAAENTSLKPEFQIVPGKFSGEPSAKNK